MLQTIREHTQGWIAGVIIGIIIITFALWGIHSYFIGGGSSNVVAEVNGSKITKEQLAVAYERLKRQLQNSHNPLINDVAIKDQALQTLIQVDALKQASYTEGFRIFDAQIDNYLQTIPEFQVDGQFSLDKFQRVLSSSMLSTNEFLNIIRTSLQIEQPKLGIIFTSFALPDETLHNIAIINQERDIQYVMLPLTYFLAQPITVSSQQIQKYYIDHQKDYMTPAEASIEYLQLSVSDLFSTIHPSEAELKNYYNENINNYTVRKGDQQDVKPQSFASVHDKVKENYVRQRAEEKFVDLREQLSNLTYEHPDSLQYAAKILNLPIQSSNLFVQDKAGKGIAQYKQVRDVAFSNDVLTLKNNSDVIQIDPQTVVVVRIKSYIPSAVVPLNHVATQIEDKIKQNDAENRGQNFVAALSKRLQDGANPKDIASNYKLNWVTPGFIGRYNTKIDTAILDLAFNLTAPQSGKTTYGIAKLANGYAIVGVKDIKAGSLEDQKQYPVFAEQVQNSEGLLEYDLYKLSVIKQAKIDVVSQD